MIVLRPLNCLGCCTCRPSPSRSPSRLSNHESPISPASTRVHAANSTNTHKHAQTPRVAWMLIPAAQPAPVQSRRVSSRVARRVDRASACRMHSALIIHVNTAEVLLRPGLQAKGTLTASCNSPRPLTRSPCLCARSPEANGPAHATLRPTRTLRPLRRDTSSPARPLCRRRRRAPS